MVSEGLVILSITLVRMSVAIGNRIDFVNNHSQLSNGYCFKSSKKCCSLRKTRHPHF